MSTNRSVGRSTATQEENRSASTQENHRSAVKPKVGRLTAKPKKDRSGLCAFTFADGRQCRTPRYSRHLHYCYFHAQKEAESLAAQQVGQDISRFLPTKLLTACDLGLALSRTFCAVARGDIKPKVASTLGYLAQTMLQSIPIAQHEYCEALGTDYWRGAIRSSFKVPSQEPSPTPQPAPQARPLAPRSGGLQAGPAPQPEHPGQPQPQPAAHPAETPVNGHSPLVTHHSPLPQSPHKPLPPTSAEFAQQLLAGRNSSRSDIPAPSGPSQDAASSSSPSSSASSSSASSPSASLPATPHVPTNCHSERSEESAFSSSSAPSTTPAPASPPKATPPSPSAPPLAPTGASSPAPTPVNSRSPLAAHHSPLPQPPPVPPGFGAPANWDVLIPPKPRRRFSRLWQSRE
jgi:hypothetical protein